MFDAPFFHDASGTVRFWVDFDGRLMGATVGREALRRRYRPAANDEHPVQTFGENRADIEAAVRTRVAAGSLEPILLSEDDLYAELAVA
jgi:hypothetical protein